MRVFSFARQHGGWWFRFGSGGPGVTFVNHKIVGPFFSERQRIGCRVHIGSWCFKWLGRLSWNA